MLIAREIDATKIEVFVFELFFYNFLKSGLVFVLSRSMEHTIAFAIMLVINWSFANGKKILPEILNACANQISHRTTSATRASVRSLGALPYLAEALSSPVPHLPCEYSRAFGVPALGFTSP